MHLVGDLFESTNWLRHLLWYFSLASVFAFMVLRGKSHGILCSRGYNLQCLKNRSPIFGRNEEVQSFGSYFTENTYWSNHEYAKLCVYATELLEYANYGNALGYAVLWRHDAQGYKGPNSGYSFIYSLRLPCVTYIWLCPLLISNLMHKILIYLHIINLLKSSTCF